MDATAQQKPKADKPDIRPVDDGQPSGQQAIEAAAKGEKLSPEEHVDALEWFLSDELDPSEVSRYEFEINVGTPDHQKWINWEVQAVDLDTLRRIRRQAQGSRQMRRARGADQNEVDEIAANLRIVVEGTVSPDLAAAAKKLGIADPSTAVRTRFAHKPGLLGQIAGQIMTLSGYDDEDIREVEAGKAS